MTEEIVLNSRFFGRTHRSAPTCARFVGTRHAVSVCCVIELPPQLCCSSLLPQEGQLFLSALFGRTHAEKTAPLSTKRGERSGGSSRLPPRLFLGKRTRRYVWKVSRFSLHALPNCLILHSSVRKAQNIVFGLFYTIIETMYYICNAIVVY